MLNIPFKYMRIQGRELDAHTLQGQGLFALCWKMIKADKMDEEDADLYKEIDAWFAEELPFPPQCNNRERVVCYFKTENSQEMMKMVKPMLWLLERYHCPFCVVYTNDPGEIVYEDKYQIVVKVEDPKIDYDYEHSWSGKED